MRRRLATILMLVIAMLVARPAHAQRAAPLIDQARAQIDQINPDSAFQLLQRALDPAAGAAGMLRVRAFTLVGIAELLRGNRVSARQAFEQALRIDPSARIDSLSYLHSEASVAFGEARTAVGSLRRPFAVSLDLPRDTIVAAREGRLRLDVRPTTPARVAITIAPLDNPLSPVWTESLVVDVGAGALWNLAYGDSGIVPEGRYLLRVAATSSSGEAAPIVEQVVRVTRQAVDTQPAPPRLDSSRLLPESLRLPRASRNRLAFGALLGVGALLTPSLLGSGDVGGGRGRAVLVGGAVAIAGVVGFLTGHRDQPLPENLAFNRQVREVDANARATAASQNVRLRAAAPIRIQAEGPPR